MNTNKLEWRYDKPEDGQHCVLVFPYHEPNTAKSVILTTSKASRYKLNEISAWYPIPDLPAKTEQERRIEQYLLTECFCRPWTNDHCDNCNGGFNFDKAIAETMAQGA